jgi:hypothetical protein
MRGPQRGPWPSAIVLVLAVTSCDALLGLGTPAYDSDSAAPTMGTDDASAGDAEADADAAIGPHDAGPDDRGWDAVTESPPPVTPCGRGSVVTTGQDHPHALATSGGLLYWIAGDTVRGSGRLLGTDPNPAAKGAINSLGTADAATNLLVAVGNRLYYTDTVGGAYGIYACALSLAVDHCATRSLAVSSTDVNIEPTTPLTTMHAGYGNGSLLWSSQGSDLHQCEIGGTGLCKTDAGGITAIADPRAANSTWSGLFDIDDSVTSEDANIFLVAPGEIWLCSGFDCSPAKRSILEFSTADVSAIAVVHAGGKRSSILLAAGVLYGWDGVTTAAKILDGTPQAGTPLVSFGDSAYWVDTQGCITKTDLSGHNTVITCAGESPSSLAIDGANVYWTTSEGSICSAPL